jgi:xanthine dehydrogenase small subunit
MRDHLLIYLNGKPLKVNGESAFVTLAEFVRRRRGLTGTKVVCAEGDCGACATMVGWPRAGGGMQYAPVNSCIQLMFQLDGAHVVTVEGLKDEKELNPLQQSMVKCQGSQCGFCTPGFVVSLYDLMQGKTAVDATAVRRGLVGNLCRCTGYESIIRAALETECGSMKTLDQMYPAGEVAATLGKAESEEVMIDGGDGKRFYKPVTVEQAVRFRGANPACLIVAGATDLGVQRNKGTREIGVVMSTAGLSELRGIRREGDTVLIGGTATLSDLEQASARWLPELSEFLAWFGSPLIKNAGTLAGNLVNASPIGDTIPAMIVLDAEIEMAGPAGRRWMKIGEFYTGYRQTALKDDEILTSVRFGLPALGEVFKLFKVSKRKDLDISSFGAAIWMQRSGNLIADVRIAYGGVAAMVVRLSKTEQLLRGRAATLELFESAGEMAADEVTPISDVRGSAEYRAALARNIMVRFWHDLQSPGHASDGNGKVNGSGNGQVGHDRTDGRTGGRMAAMEEV